MPIVKVPDNTLNKSSAVFGSGAKSSGPDNDGVASPNHFVRLRSTGLLQERLRIDAGFANRADNLIKLEINNESPSSRPVTPSIETRAALKSPSDVVSATKSTFDYRSVLKSPNSYQTQDLTQKDYAYDICKVTIDDDTCAIKQVKARFSLSESNEQPLLSRDGRKSFIDTNPNDIKEFQEQNEMLSRLKSKSFSNSAQTKVTPSSSPPDIAPNQATKIDIAQPKDDYPKKCDMNHPDHGTRIETLEPLQQVVKVPEISDPIPSESSLNISQNFKETETTSNRLPDNEANTVTQRPRIDQVTQGEHAAAESKTLQSHEEISLLQTSSPLSERKLKMQTSFIQANVSKYQFSINDAQLEETDVLEDLKEMIQSQSSLFGGADDSSRRRLSSTIVKAIQSCLSPGPSELKFEEGDVLLVLDSSSNPGWLLAKHEISGETGLVNPSHVQSDRSLFAEVLALTERSRADTIKSEKSDRLKNGENESSPKKQIHLKDLAKVSKFNESFDGCDSDVPRRRSRSPTMEESWASRVGEEVTKTIEKNEKKRQEAIYEYVETERSFVEDMEMVIEGFVRPLEDMRIISKDEVHEIFSNIHEILQISIEMSSLLSQRQVNMHGIMSSIGDILLQELPRLRNFAPFCANISHAVQVLVEKKKSSQSFAEKLRELERNPYFGNMDLTSFLLKPMQRITKIPLLIKGILKYTTPSHEDYAQLTQAETISQEILFYVNTKCGDAEERQKLEKIQIKLNSDLIQDLGMNFFDYRRRKLLHGGMVECNEKKCNIYLFDDCLIITQSKIVNKAERFSLWKPLVSLWLLEVNTPESSVLKRGATKMFSGNKSSKESQKSFQITDLLNNTVYEITGISTRDRDLWSSAISSAQKALQDSAGFELKRLRPFTFQTSSKTKRISASSEQASGMFYKEYLLLSNHEGLSAAPAYGSTGVEFNECPGFNTQFGRLVYDDDLGQMILLNAKTNSVESYPLDNMDILLKYMFENQQKSGPPGMKLIKLPNSQGTLTFDFGTLKAMPHVACITPKSLLVYQYSSNGKFYKKIGEISCDGFKTNFVSIHSSKVMLGIGNKFYEAIIEGEGGYLKELCDPNLAEDVQNSTALQCFSLGGDKYLLCYNNIGAFIERVGDSIKVGNYFPWKSAARGFQLCRSNVIVFSSNIIEIWNVETAQLKQLISVPGFQLLDKRKICFCVDSDSSQQTICHLEAKK